MSDSDRKPGDARPAQPAAGDAPPEAGTESCRPDAKKPRELGGPAGPEPTRYGDWEVGGRCSDF